MWKVIRIVRDIANPYSQTRIRIRWWLLGNPWARKLGWTFLVLVVLAGLITLVWYRWDWIGKNAAPLMAIGTCVTGLALATFAYLTYKLSRQMAEFQYAPVLEVHSVHKPETGEVKTEYRPAGEIINPITGKFEKSYYEDIYYGVKWKVCLMNPGDTPVWVEKIHVEVQPPLGRWTGIGRLCELLDEDDRLLDQGIGVNGHSQRNITVLLRNEKTKEHLERLYPGESEFIMRVLLFQLRRLGKSSGWLSVVSEKFSLPSKFGLEQMMDIVTELNLAQREVVAAISAKAKQV